MTLSQASVVRDEPIASARGRVRTRLFVAWALIFLTLVAVAFGPSLFLRPLFGTTDYALGTRSLPAHLLWHGVALTAWYVLFIVQTGLVMAGRVNWHRRLGVAGVLVAAAVVATSLLTMARFLLRVNAWAAANGVDGQQLEEGIRQGVVRPVVGGSWSLLLFVLFVGAGVYFRRRSASHKRCMLLASLAILGPVFAASRPIGRLLAPALPPQIGGPVFLLVCLGAIVAYDLATVRRVELATWWGIAANVGVTIVTGLMAGGESGLAYTRWLASVF